jgi:hypothetical protein
MLFDGFYAFYQRNFTSARFFFSDIFPNGKFYFQIGENLVGFSLQNFDFFFIKEKW